MTEVTLFMLVVSLSLFYMINSIMGLMGYYILGKSLMGFLIFQAIASILLIIIIPAALNLI